MCAEPVQRVTFVGVTGAHVRMLAAGLAWRGVGGTVADPGRMGADLGLDTIPDVAFTAVEFGDRPRPAEAKVILALRRLLTSPHARPDVAHAHRTRAGALTAIALVGCGGTPGRRAVRIPKLIVTVQQRAAARRGSGPPHLSRPGTARRPSRRPSARRL